MHARIVVLGLLSLATTPALAHEGKGHAPGDQHDEKRAAPPAAHHPGEHAHESPHGGITATVDKDTHVEVVFSDTTLGVYFYDSEMKPVALPLDAKATVVVGKEVKKLDLPIGKKPDGTLDDHLVGELAIAADQKVAVVIQATVFGKARTARVERTARQATATKPAAQTTSPAPSASKETL